MQSMSQYAAKNRMQAASTLRRATEPKLTFRKPHFLNNCHFIYLGMNEELCRMAKFLPGDRLEIMFDTGGNGLLKRVKDGGYKLSPNGYKRKGYKSGDFVPCVLSIRHYNGMPIIWSSAPCHSIRVTSDGVEFKFPAGTSYSIDQQAKAA